MDQDEAYRRIWQTFRTFDHLADGRHDTEDWRSHEGCYAVCVIRVPTPLLQPSLDGCRAALATYPWIRLHPDHFLHVTLQELGFVCDNPERPDEITPARLEEFASAAAGPVGERDPFDLVLGGVNSFQDAAFLDVEDSGHCARMHGRLFELAAIPRAPRFAYLPHATIAHYTREAPVDNMAGDLARWRDVPFGAFRVSQVEIVTLRLDQSYPPLEPYAIIPLRG